MGVTGRRLEGRRKGEAREFLSPMPSALGCNSGSDYVSTVVPPPYKQLLCGPAPTGGP